MYRKPSPKRQAAHARKLEALRRGRDRANAGGDEGMTMTLWPRITCARCTKPVDRMAWWDDHETGDRVLRVYCHGAQDEMRLDMRGVSQRELDALQAAEGVAFGPPLDNGQSRESLVQRPAIAGMDYSHGAKDRRPGQEGAAGHRET